MAEEQAKAAGFRVAVRKGALDELDALRSAYQPQFECDALTAEARDQFEFESENFYLGSTRLASLKVNGWRYERSARHCSRSLSDAISIGFYQSGFHTGIAHGTELNFGAGDIIVTQVDRPTKITSTGSRSIRVMIDRHLIAPYVVDTDRLHGLVLRRGTAMNAMLGAFLTELNAQAAGLSAFEADALGKATATVAAACLGAEPGVQEAMSPDMDLAKLTLLRRTIEAHLGHPQLGPDFLAKECGLSRSGLYRLFEPFGGVRKYIQERRLERARADLLAVENRERIGVIAARWGFVDLAAFSRAFSLRYGVSPREVSREGRSIVFSDSFRSGGAKEGFSALSHWLKEA